MASVRIRREGPYVLQLDSDGKVLTRMPWNQAIEYARIMIQVARVAESSAKAENIIFDQAIALRVGLPVGFSDDPRINDEARKEAAWNEKLRRWFKLPDVRRRRLGTPSLISLDKKDG